MVYSRSLKALQRVERHLNILAKSHETVEFADDDPVTTAHLIRQGIKVAGSHTDKGEPYVTYAGLLQKYIIRTRNNKIVAEPREKEPLLVAQKAMSEMVLRNHRSILEVIGAAIKHKAPVMTFPDANPITLPVEKLNEWARSNKYEVDVVDNQIILKREE